MTRFAITRLLLLVVVLLTACATGPRSIEIPQSRLEAALARKFPLETRAGDLFLVKVGSPRLTLLPDSNRLRLDFGVDASDRIVRSAVHGELALSFALRYDASDASVRLADVHAERIELQGVPPRWRADVESAAAVVVERMLEGVALHTFSPEELARARGWRPGAIRVTPGGLLVELLPSS
jgi:hypothetical protein